MESLVECQSEPYCRALQARVEAWLSTPESRDVPGAGLYSHLPRFYTLLVNTALDPVVPPRERTAVCSALKYIVAPYDLIPEAVVGTTGFRDDLVLAALMVERLAGVLGGPALRSRWQGGDDPAELARAVLDASGALVDPEVSERLHHWLPQ
jgi:uncharacterized membrane protein YkvA (DUF1232 family)